MATKNKAAAAAPMTPVQKAAATKAAKAAEAVKDAAPAKAVKSVPAKADKAAAPPKAEKVKVVKEPKPAKVEAVNDDSVETASTEGTEVHRKQLAEAVRGRMKDAGYGVSSELCLAMVGCFEKSVENAIASGSNVNLPGFGKFNIAMRPGGTRRNPATGGTVEVDAKWAVSFKVGKALKTAVQSRPTAE